MQRKWIAVAAGVAVVAVLLVGGQLLLTRKAAPNSAAPAGPSASATGTAGTPAASGTVPAIRQPAPAKLKPITATRAAGAGKPLHPLASSPTDVVSGISAGRIANLSSYNIRFKPWGYGPGSKRGSNVVITIVSATGVGGSPAANGLSKRLILAVMDDTKGGVVYNGGVSSGVLTFVQDGATLYPTLSNVVEQAP